jgi:hypothetical protein
MKLFETILAVVCIFIAIYNFDFYNLNRCIVSVLLLMQAGMILLPDEKLKKILRTASVGLAIFLIIKILISG